MPWASIWRAAGGALTKLLWWTDSVNHLEHSCTLERWEETATESTTVYIKPASKMYLCRRLLLLNYSPVGPLVVGWYETDPSWLNFIQRSRTASTPSSVCKPWQLVPSNCRLAKLGRHWKAAGRETSFLYLPKIWCRRKPLQLPNQRHFQVC